MYPDSPYVSLPYGNPTSGQFFGPALIGGPPGSRINRNSYRSRNAYTADIVKRLQQRFDNDYDTKKGNMSAKTAKSLDQTITHSDPDIRSSHLDAILHNSLDLLELNAGDGSHDRKQILAKVLNADAEHRRQQQFTGSKNCNEWNVSERKDVFKHEKYAPLWKSLDYDCFDDGGDDVLDSSAGAVSIAAVLFDGIGGEADDEEVPRGNLFINYLLF